MKRPNLLFYCRNYLQIPTLAVFLSPFIIGSLASAKTSPNKEIHVTLLGQPCLLEGPFDEKTLTAIHSIGPAQIYPNISTTSDSTLKEEARRALTKLKNNKGLPSLLDRYREKLGRRLEAQLAFLDAVSTNKNSAGAGRELQKSASLTQVGEKYLSPVKFPQFEKLCKKLDGLSGTKYRELLDQVLDFYNGGIEPDPEEEFHRTIKKMNVQYTCSFEEAEGTPGD